MDTYSKKGQTDSSSWHLVGGFQTSVVLMRNLARHRLCVFCIDSDWRQSAFGAVRKKGFEIGAHTVDHPILSHIEAHRLERKLTESKQRIETELGEESPCIAYQNGGSHDVFETGFDAARKAGYKLGFTVAEQHSEPGEGRLQSAESAFKDTCP